VPDFKFRAAAALDLRSQQERAAAAVSARAEADLRAACGLRDAAEMKRTKAREALGDEQARGTDIDTLLWHRNWISSLTAAVAQRSTEVDRRAAVTHTAALAWREARRKRLALERLRELAWRRYQQSEASAERKTIDELARLRFVLRDDESDKEHFK
jgi:flagellar export protein FliJ